VGVLLYMEPSAAAASELPGNELVTTQNIAASHASSWVPSYMGHSILGLLSSAMRGSDQNKFNFWMNKF
jgi:hypothetical protein